jgi:cytochrome c oxidase subunit III
LSTAVQVPPPRTSLATLPVDQTRGVSGMWCVIATEAMLFVCMFGAYYYLGNNKDRWSLETPPKLLYALILLAILLSSSFVLHWGEQQVKAGRFSSGRVALWLTVLLGVVFLGLQGFEYYDHWKELAPYSDSYGSIFYTITSLHAAHVIVGLLLLAYIGVLPHWGIARRTPHAPYHTIALYWHFVDVVWVFIVALLYVIPTFQAMHHGH